MPWCGPQHGSKVLSTGDWFDVMPSFWGETASGCNFNHLHAVQLKGRAVPPGRKKKGGWGVVVIRPGPFTQASAWT